jgi:DNA polymerase III subunit epsilon
MGAWRWSLSEAWRARRVRRALAPELRERLHRVRRDFDARPGLAQPLALARFVALDLETTGPRMHLDRVISIGAVAVTGRSVRHDDCYEALLRQERSSAVDNILVHQIGGQQQLAGMDPAEALVACLEYVGDSRVVAFRAEFDATVFEREVRERLGCQAWPRFIDLALLLPALFPGTANDTLDDWVGHFGLPPIGRHHAIADAYATAQLLMILLEAAPRSGIETAADLCDAEQAQRWLGRRR